MKIITVYSNGTIRLPQELINKLDLKKGTKLVIEAKYDGFVACKIEYYQSWVDKLDRELLELDAHSRKIFAKRINNINNRDKDKTEVL